MNIDLTPPNFDTKYSIYETSFQEKQTRSRKFYQTLDKVASVAAVLGGIAGFVGFAAVSRGFYLSLKPGEYSRDQQLALMCVLTLGLLPVAWLALGVLMPMIGGAIGYGLAHLTGRIVAHVKKIDYFSPKLSDYQFSQQNQGLKAQRDSLEKLFYAKHYDNEMAVTERVKSFLENSKPLSAQFATDPEFTKILNPLENMTSFSQERFYTHLHGMSNAQLKQSYYTYDASIQQLETQFEQAKNQLKTLLDRKISVINSFAPQAAA